MMYKGRWADLYVNLAPTESPSGHPEYGCFISKGKTLTNFYYDEEIMNITGPKDKSFPWCGYLIDMKDLSICNDYTRYHNGREFSPRLSTYCFT